MLIENQQGAGDGRHLHENAGPEISDDYIVSLPSDGNDMKLFTFCLRQHCSKPFEPIYYIAVNHMWIVSLS